ncbi:MAG: GNAT family N-acetyltransferase [Oscillospiraceae bacterium]|nr:GNAT family N-acetyltransferase [Oscillospiraceae bacterium]
MDILFRKMELGDRDEVLGMMRVFYRSAAVYTNGSEEIFANDFDNCIGDCPYLEGYIFLSDGEVCGYSMLAKSFSTEFGKPCIWVEDLYLKEPQRGLGIGSRFFDYLEEQYENQDVIFRLEVEKENEAAVHLYRKKGYGELPYLEMKK